MKKLNFNNQVSHDDEMLISILKTSISQQPSEKFAENTLEKFLILKAKKEDYKPLRFPLYLMLVIGLILLAHVFFSFDSEISFPDHGFELENLVDNIPFQLDSWYTLSLMILVLVSMLIVWVESGLVKFRNPFV